MKCKYCKHKFPNSKLESCPECGREIENQQKKRLSKKLYIAIPLIILLLGVPIAYFILNNNKQMDLVDPMEKVQSFKETVINEDSEALVELLTPYENSFEINREDAMELISFFQENPEYYNTILNSLEDKATAYSSEEEPVSTKSHATITLLKNEEDKDYDLVVIPAFIDILTSDAEIDLLINNKVVDTIVDKGTHRETYGPYMPGIYEVKAKFDNNYVSTEQTNQVTLFNLDTDSTKLEFNLDIGMIQIVSTFEDEATLFINERETDFIINKGTQSIGPFPLNENISIHLEKKMPWETVVSEPLIIDSSELEYNFSKTPAISKEEEEKIINVINNVFLTYTDSVNARDASVLEDNVSDIMVEKVNETISHVESHIPDYEGTLLSTQYKVNWYQDPLYDNELEAYKLKMDVMLHYYEPNGHLGRIFEGENPHEYLRGATVELLFDEDIQQWLVYDYEFSHFFTYEDDIIYEFN
ncbi:hypothetical protein KGF86_09065 [Ornithinibacillus massiliensis]|uniref:Zinc ribbon domain-containing protein n=1 Tax=Ornithinibacillus massiliensis TaxID=1944633 RepID=A0ABS5MDF1_9BACI|nr:hypothetical protein [Ornithinibacillus massiliensis]MBS3680365.1 hypothetical protein [Ornithinibacillus massiliensis]